MLGGGSGGEREESARLLSQCTVCLHLTQE